MLVDLAASSPSLEARALPVLLRSPSLGQLSKPSSASQGGSQIDVVLAKPNLDVESRQSKQSEPPIDDGQNSRILLTDLPVEIHEAILDHLFGVRSSTSKASPAITGTHSWSTLLRHPRRKQLSNLALLSPTWRELVQERLYRHIKIKGTKQELAGAQEWFLVNPRLQGYVKHVEYWFPVWERKPNTDFNIIETVRQTAPERAPPAMAPVRVSEYQQASHNASLEEILYSLPFLFPTACILTLEGGHCKKPPMVTYFERDQKKKCLPTVPGVHSLVLKGAWNIIREEIHFRTLARALPNVREFHCSYSAPKAGAYLIMAHVLPTMPFTLTHLNLSIEGFYSKEIASPHMWNKVFPHSHLCLVLARLAPQLEAFTYTGRICSQFFLALADSASRSQSPSKLRSLDVIVKNSCRVTNPWASAAGITNWTFIKSFESLVIAAAYSLDKLPLLNDVRVRFIDLDSPHPLMNPYFQLKNNDCYGIWSPEIQAALAESRPAAQYADFGNGLTNGPSDLLRSSSGSLARPLCIRTTSYASLASSNQH